jgi:hypothetical protein
MIPGPQIPGLPKQPGIIVQDEVWGRLMPNIGPGDFGRRRPGPMELSLAGIFDGVTGLSGYLPAVPDELREHLMEVHLARLRPVANVLRKLRCVRCGQRGTIRYLPRILMPIDLDLSPEAHSDRARRRTLALHRARSYVSSYPALSELFWIPPMYDRGELLTTSKGLFDLLDTHGGRPADEHARYWQVAIWTQMAVMRKSDRRSGGYWESQIHQIKDGFVPSSTAKWSTVEARLRELPETVSRLRRSGQAVERALAILDTLMTPPYRDTRDTLRRYCEIHIYPHAQKHRRRSHRAG